MSAVVPVVTCEHAGNRVPMAYQYLFDEAATDLSSHLGWDPGAHYWADRLAQALDTDLISYPYSRLLIEVNRSEDSVQLFSRYSAELSRSIKKYLITTYYRPYRRNVRETIARLLDEEKIVLHLSVHSFTPVFSGEVRAVEIGLLFDESRQQEVDFCNCWKKNILALNANLQVRMNEPYQGKDDGICTSLRSRFSAQNYLGIELEVSQKFVASGKKAIADLLIKSLTSTLHGYKNSRNQRFSG